MTNPTTGTMPRTMHRRRTMEYEIGDYETQHGKPAKVLFIDDDDDGNMYGIAKSGVGGWRPVGWNKDGDSHTNNVFTLAPLRREWWIVGGRDAFANANQAHGIAESRRIAGQPEIDRTVVHVREVLNDD